MGSLRQKIRGKFAEFEKDMLPEEWLAIRGALIMTMVSGLALITSPFLYDSSEPTTIIFNIALAISLVGALVSIELKNTVPLVFTMIFTTTIIGLTGGTWDPNVGMGLVFTTPFVGMIRNKFQMLLFATIPPILILPMLFTLQGETGGLAALLQFESASLRSSVWTATYAFTYLGLSLAFYYLVTIYTSNIRTQRTFATIGQLKSAIKSHGIAARTKRLEVLAETLNSTNLKSGKIVLTSELQKLSTIIENDIFTDMISQDITHPDIFTRANLLPIVPPETKLVVDDAAYGLKLPKGWKLVISNLLQNAHKHAKNARLTVDVEQKFFRKGVVFTVSDKGSGLPASVLSDYKVDPFFFKLSESTVGHGLGTYIIRAVSRVIQAKIAIDSSSKGTIVTVTVPTSNLLNQS